MGRAASIKLVTGDPPFCAHAAALLQALESNA
jgi:hypothetical protein